MDFSSHGTPTTLNRPSRLVNACPICDSQEQLSRCAACKVISYCSREHQIADRPFHKTFCTNIKKAQARLDHEDAALRNHPGDVMMPPNPFETAAGLFWGIFETRNYMRARFAVVEALEKINTRAAVSQALEHILDMLRLCRGDNMGVRDIAPGLFLRLGRDQECYDFVKWWATTARKGGYDWGDTDLPYLDIKDADAFESVAFVTGKFANLAHLLAVMLVKIRILIDLQTLHRTKSEAEPRIRVETVDEIGQHFVGSIVTARHNELEQENLGPRIKELEKQIKSLYDAAERENPHMWPALLDPGNHLTAKPVAYVRGSKEEMQLKLLYFYSAFVETPGAIAVIEALAKA